MGATNTKPKLRDQNLLMRLGLTGLLLTMALGLWASVKHLLHHYDKRDEVPGMTLDDVKAAYHGLDSPSKLLASLQRNHPEELPQKARQSLIAWLEKDKVAENYDNLDLGDDAPAELLAAHCVKCHARNATDEVAKKLPLESWDDVRKVAFSRRVNPTPKEVVMMSMHAHAPAMATMSLVLAIMACFSRLPGWLGGGVCALMGVGLFADLGAWHLARGNADWVYAIVAGGAAYNGATALLIVLLLLDLWLPRRAGTSETQP